MDTITPAQFFAAVFPEPFGPGQLMVWSKIRRSGKTMVDWCFGLHQAARQVEAYRRTREVLFGVALHDRKKALARARRRLKRAAPSSVRGGEESVVALPALWAEIRVAGSEPTADSPSNLLRPLGALQRRRAQALSFLEAVPRPPSIVVWTGTALQVYWLLAGRGDGKLWVLEEAEERRHAKRLLGKVRWALACAAAAEGWPAGTVTEEAGSDLAGLMRVAGTFHHRDGRRPGNRRWPIVVERLPQAGSDRRWAPADFEKLEDPPPRPDQPCPWEEPRRPAAAGAGEGSADFEAVWRGCAWLRHCHRDQATLAEAEWIAALSIVGRGRAGSGSPDSGSPEVGSPEVADGQSLAHSFSARHPGYAPEATDEALKRALRPKAATCRRIGRDLGAWKPYCSRCPHQGRIESPIDLGVRDQDEGPRELPAAIAPAAAASPPASAAEARDGEELLFGPIAGGQPRVELVVRIPLGSRPLGGDPQPPWPASWAPVARAAIANLERSIPAAARGAGTGGNPATAVRRYPVGPPVVRAPGVPASRTVANLVDGLEEELLATLGPMATARQMVEALAAPQNRDRFGQLRAALRNFVPVPDGGLPTARQLGRALGACRGRDAGGRSIVPARRLRLGIAWAVRETGQA